MMIKLLFHYLQMNLEVYLLQDYLNKNKEIEIISKYLNFTLTKMF